MRKELRPGGLTSVVPVALIAAAGALAAFGTGPIAVTPAKMARIGTVDERYQSFNVEMVEVTGGRFWAPYGQAEAKAPAPPQKQGLSTPGLDQTMFRQRPPGDGRAPKGYDAAAYGHDFGVFLPFARKAAIAGQPTPAGRRTLAPASLTFLAFPDAANASCR